MRQLHLDIPAPASENPALPGADILLSRQRTARRAAPRPGWKAIQLILLLLLVILEGCATDSSKPSPVAIEVDRLQETLLSITESYEKKDEKTFFSKLDPAFQPLTPFREQVLRDFKNFSEANIRLVIERVQIEPDAAVTAVRWGGTWKSGAGAPPLEKKGHALFRWTPGENPQLLEIKGDPPFGIFPGGS